MTDRGLKQQPIYLDHAAATPVDPEVLGEMLPYFSHRFGNPGSRVHGRGLTAEAAVDNARHRVASLLGARPVEITFTSGATESNNLALKGVSAAWNYDCDLLISATEHPSVQQVANELIKQGVRVSVLPVGTDGRMNPQTLEATLQVLAHRPRILVSVMHANNETGVVNPIDEIGALCQRFGAVLHCDASQSVGKIPVEVDTLGVDLLSLSAHKFYGPKGVGALYVRRRRPRIPLAAQAHGGGQERGLRSGTLNVPGIVGLGAAAACAAQQLERESSEFLRLTRLMIACLRERLSGVEVNGSEVHRLPSFLNLSFRGIPAERLQTAIRPVVEISSGSACSTGTVAPSLGLLALGLPASRTDGAVRLSLGRFTTEEDIHRVMDAIVCEVLRIRQQQNRQKQYRQRQYRQRQNRWQSETAPIETRSEHRVLKVPGRWDRIAGLELALQNQFSGGVTAGLGKPPSQRAASASRPVRRSNSEKSSTVRR